MFVSVERTICDEARTTRKTDWLSELEIEVVKRKISQEKAEEILMSSAGNMTADGSVDNDGIQQN